MNQKGRIMIKKLATITAALGILAMIGLSLSSFEASAGRTTKCWRCTGGWCCY